MLGIYITNQQSITIYKLRDNETNEEFLEFDENIVFQTACDDCLNIKTCLNSGHRLVDWRPTFAGGRAAGDPVGSPEADERDGETSACDSKETSSDSGSAVATAPVVGAAVAEGGGVCGKGKTKARGARAVEEVGGTGGVCSLLLPYTALAAVGALSQGVCHRASIWHENILHFIHTVGGYW